MKSSINSKNGLRVSTRDWDADTKKKESNIQDLSLVSRSDSNEKYSLKDKKLQLELWKLIESKTEQAKEKNKKSEWDGLVDQLRKLREGIYASRWSNGDYSFCIKVFELSVDCCIRAERYEELTKSLIGLIEQLYPLKKDASKPYFNTLYVIYYCCFIQNIQKAKVHAHTMSRKTNEGAFAKRLVEATLTQNSILFFKLYHYNPYDTFKSLMKQSQDSVRKQALEVLRKAYLSSSLDWVGQWLGIYNDPEALTKEIQRILPQSIKSIDHQFIYFQKNIKK